ncbi:hypothetical protein ACQKNC_09690 [Lysinibacillus sp. NPDC094177]|uniref:hypothetical protein n=1 Tax=Lysinibacillus sp. NPDC094177 TaxID=3390580 RepID=UPI003CFE551D
MGLKMPKAYSDKLKRDITVEEAVKESIKEDIFCTSKECRIPLTLVGAFMRNSSLVSAHFKRRGREEHKNCDYNTLGQINIAARDSEGALASINAKKYSLRLNLISKAIKNSDSSKKKESTDVDIDNTKQPTKNYISSGKISAYLATMKKIMQIKSKIENEKELRSLIEIQFNDNNIKWSDFYFEFDDYEKCFSKLMNNKLDYPICIEGEIKNFERATENFSYHTIKLKLKFLGENEDGKNKFASVSIWISDENIFEKLKKDFESGKNHVAFCSNMWASRVDRTSEFLNITGKVYNMKQIYMY